MSIVGNRSVPAGTIRFTGTRERRSGIIGSGSGDVGRRLFGEKKLDGKSSLADINEADHGEYRLSECGVKFYDEPLGSAGPV